jgi:hypothetical protein
LRILFVLLFSVLVSACSGGVLDYAKTQYPGCTVTEIESSSTHTIMQIKCPGNLPFKKTFRSGK